MGDHRAIQDLVAADPGASIASCHRLGPLLATRIYRQKLQPRREWQISLRKATISRMLIEQAQRDLEETFDDLNIPNLSLKGMGAMPEYYPRPESRPTSDLDVLIPREKLDLAIKVLSETGWKPSNEGCFNPNSVYNWKAIHRTGTLLELHFALWGGVDTRLADRVLHRAKNAPEPGPLRLRSSAPDLHIIGASHLWNSPRPRVLIYFLDLHFLASKPIEGAPALLRSDAGLASSVIELAREHELQLFVGLSAAITNSLWPHPTNASIATTLLKELKLPEKLLLRAGRNKPTADLHLGSMTIARLLGRRKTRSGWKAISRHVQRASFR